MKGKAQFDTDPLIDVDSDVDVKNCLHLLDVQGATKRELNLIEQP